MILDPPRAVACAMLPSALLSWSTVPCWEHQWLATPHVAHLEHVLRDLVLWSTCFWRAGRQWSSPVCDSRAKVFSVPWGHAPDRNHSGYYLVRVAL